LGLLFWLWLCGEILLGLLGDHALEKLLADFCDAVVVVRPVGAFEFEEGELRFVLLSVHEYLFEAGAVGGNVLGRLLQQF
jgi:hypothetical protein